MSTETPGIRSDRVMLLLNLRMRMSDAGDREIALDPTREAPDFNKAKRALAEAERTSTRGEIWAAIEAAKRHGYT